MLTRAPTPALYVSLVEAPALEELHDSGGDALAYFRAFFPKASALQSPMAFTAATLSIGTFIVGTDKIRMPGGYVLDNGPSRAPWLVSGMLMGSIIPCALPACVASSLCVLRTTVALSRFAAASVKL
jgi:hypothetical protein